MIRKFRNAESYYGNTAEAKRNQRNNLIPGNSWQKRKMQQLRLNCFWGTIPFNKKIICEAVENKREIKDVPGEELKSKKYLDDWWGKLELEKKKRIYKNIMAGLTKELKSDILKDVGECLKRKLALLKGDF